MITPLDSLPPGNDDSTLKKDFHEETFQVYSNPLFEFDDNFKFSNVNPLFEENDKDAEIKSSSFFTLTSPEEIEFEAYLERDLITPGINLTLPPTLKVSSSNSTSPTLIGEKDLKKDLTMSFDSTTTSILPHPLLDSDSPFTAELSASVILNSLGNEDKVFKPGKDTPDACLKNVVLNFHQNQKTFPLNVEDVNSFAFIIWTFLPFFTYTKESPLIFSFKSENFVFDLGIITFHNPVDSPNKFNEASRVRLIYPVRIYQKSHKNSQKNGQAWTRESEEYNKESEEYKAEARKVKPQSKSARKSTSVKDGS
ncbi:hypothetical protein Tco_0145642 [Tanacetum coccineum]